MGKAPWNALRILLKIRALCHSSRQSSEVCESASTCTGWINSWVILQVYISSSRQAQRQSRCSSNSIRLRSNYTGRNKIGLSSTKYDEVRTFQIWMGPISAHTYQCFRKARQSCSTIWHAVVRSSPSSVVPEQRRHSRRMILASSVFSVLRWGAHRLRISKTMILAEKVDPHPLFVVVIMKWFVKSRHVSKISDAPLGHGCLLLRFLM